MNNIDEVIKKSLSLISYDRSKHITEQSYLKKNNLFEVDMDGYEPYHVQQMEKEVERDRLVKQREKERLKYVKNPIVRPTKETTDNENDIPYLTLHSVVNNKNIYLPQKSIFVPEKPQKSFKDIISDLNKTMGVNRFQGFVKTPNFYQDYFSKFNEDLAKIKEKEVKILENKIIKKITSSEPFNQEIAENYFGSQCLKLSGRHPKYDVGYVKELDYYIDGSGEQCFPIPQKTIVKQDGKTNTEVNVYQLDLPKPITLKNGNNIQKSKYKYKNGCRPVDYQFCLTWSWKSLHSNGSQEDGVLEFEEISVDENAPTTGSAGGFEPSKTTKTEYRGCITDEWFPWTNSFVGYLKKSDFKIDTDSSGKKQYTKCVRNGYTTTGVNLVEDYLTKYNLQSGIKTLNVVPYDNVLKFTLPEAIKKSTGKDFKLSGNYFNYTVDNHYWFSWGSDDYKNFNKGININFQDYLNNVEEEKDIYDSYLKDLYGIETKGEKGEILTDKEMGIQNLEKMMDDTKTLSALKAKWNEIMTTFGTEGDYISILIKLSDDYNTEKSKPKANDLILSYLEDLWNTTLTMARMVAYQSFIDLSKSGSDTEDEFTILYLAKIFGIYDKNNEKVMSLISGKLDLFDYIDQGLEVGKEVGKTFKEIGKGILRTLIPKELKGAVGNSLDKDEVKSEYRDVLDPKIWSEISKYPLLLPNDFNDGGKNTKNVKPITIEDATTRAKSEGPKNGFLYKEQKVLLEGSNKELINNYKYSNIVSNLSNTDQSSEDKGPKTDEEMLKIQEALLKTYEEYEKKLSEILSNTITLIGR